MRIGQSAMGAGFLAGALLLAGLTASAQDEASTPKPAVLVAPVVNQSVATSDVFVGTIEAIQEVELRARVEGFLEKVLFQEGQMVKAGQLLYQIQKAQYQASLDQANANEKQAEASLQSAQARVADTAAEFDRQAALLTRGNTSQARYDQAKAARDEAQADVSEANAQIASAKSDIEQAQLNLSYTDISTPIAGKIGKTAITQGNLVDANSGVLATVVQLDPIRVVFSISDSEYVEVRQQLLKDNVQEGDKVFDFGLTLPTGEPYQYPGTFSFVDNQVDPDTGTIAIRANFQNPQQLLIPGQFVRVTTSEAKPTTMPVVPAKAVQQDRKGRYVFVLGKDDRAERRDIKVGQRVKEGWAVTEGLVSGEMVIVEGIQKIANGVQVAPSQAKANQSKSGQSNSGQTDNSGGEAATTGEDASGGGQGASSGSSN